jgi:hypothetical protein
METSRNVASVSARQLRAALLKLRNAIKRGLWRDREEALATIEGIAENLEDYSTGGQS